MRRISISPLPQPHLAPTTIQAHIISPTSPPKEVCQFKFSIRCSACRINGNQFLKVLFIHNYFQIFHCRKEYFCSKYFALRSLCLSLSFILLSLCFSPSALLLAHCSGPKSSLPLALLKRFVSTFIT